VIKRFQKIIKMQFTKVTPREFVTRRKGNWHRTNHVKRWELFRWAEIHIHGDSGRLVLILAMICAFSSFGLRESEKDSNHLAFIFIWWTFFFGP